MSNEFNFKNTVIFESLPQKSLPANNAEKEIDYSYSVIDYKNDKIVINLDSGKAGYLVLSEIYYPGWKAEALLRPGAR